jgi:hypothetical protein
MLGLTAVEIRATQSIQGWGVDVPEQTLPGEKGMQKEMKRLEVCGNNLNDSSLTYPDAIGEIESFGQEGARYCTVERSLDQLCLWIMTTAEHIGDAR